MSDSSSSDTRLLTITDHELADRLSWFINIRWFAGLIAAVFLLIAWNFFGIRFAVAPVMVAVGVLFLYNAGLVLAVKSLRQSSRLTRSWVYVIANIQVVCDLISVAVIWHYCGGVENAFAIFFIFPMVWASELLPRRNAYLHALLGAVLVNAVVWGEYTGVIGHVHLQRAVDHGSVLESFVPAELYRDWAFVFMVGFTFAGSLFVTVFLAGTVAARLRYRENQLEESNRSLKSVDMMKSHFMRKVSHELRAPLAAIHVMLKTVLSGLTGKVDARQEDMIVRACERTDSLMNLINDLLRYSRLEAEAGARVVLKPVNFGDVVRRTIELLSPSAEEKSIRLSTQVRPVTVMADEEGLTELATNLLSNAIRYSQSGGQVTVALAPKGRQARFVVEDQGIGIAPEDLPHVFDEFFRSEAAKQAVQHGTGMGLAIVRRLVDTYRGTVNVASQPGKGTTFTVTLPLVG